MTSACKQGAREEAQAVLGQKWFLPCRSLGPGKATTGHTWILCFTPFFRAKPNQFATWKALRQSCRHSVNQPLLGSRATTQFLPNGSCPAAKMPALGWDTASVEDYRSAEPRHKMCQARQENHCNSTGNSAVPLRDLLSAGSEECPRKTTPPCCTH